MKQEGHIYSINSHSYSPNGEIIIAGDDIGKLKVWKEFSGKCIVTFQDNEAPITSVDFSENGKFFASSSLDGKLVFTSKISFKLSVYFHY